MKERLMTKGEFADFNSEMNRLKNIKWKSYTATLKEVGVTYLGKVAQSAKMLHSYEHHFSTYCLYLAAADLSGFNVCPKNDMCKANCLMGSGRNKVSRLSGRDDIDGSRITKTRLFFANREVFMRLMLHEIKLEKKRAKLRGHEFSVRINGTSDLNPTLFKLGKKNILQMFPNVMFYDYTKVPNYLELMKKYPNYDITWSIDWSKDNFNLGMDYLKEGGRIAVVFGTETMPKTFMGYKVIDGDKYDARYKDGNVVVGLKFKRTAENFKKGKFVMPNTEFIVREGDLRCKW